MPRAAWPDRGCQLEVGDAVAQRHDCSASGSGSPAAGSPISNRAPVAQRSFPAVRAPLQHE